MNKPKHTPGKWTAVFTEEEALITAPATCGGGHWFTLAQCDRKLDNCDANAQLIAAAPELYKACDEALRLLCHVGYENGKGEINLETAMETIVSLKNALSVVNPEEYDFDYKRFVNLIGKELNNERLK